MEITSNISFGLDELTCKRNPDACPVIGCNIQPRRHPHKRLRFCEEHGLEVHGNTFVYYNGDTAEARRLARLRNILPFLRDFAARNVLDNRFKAESHRLGAENSEDALTYNVFAGLHRCGHLHKVYDWLTGESSNQAQVQLFLWGLRVNLETNSLEPWHPLLEVRKALEKGIKRFLTEPDIMLLGPNQLVCIEAKFTSGNPLCVEDSDLKGEKPKSRIGLIERYIANNTLWSPPVLSSQDVGQKVHSQLLRMLVFTSTMAQRLDRRLDWKVANLVSKTQWAKHGICKGYDFQDPTSALPEKVAERFRFTSWEQLYDGVLCRQSGLEEIQKYFEKKTANLERAFKI